MATGLFYDKVFLEHDTGQGHPECPARLSETIKYLSKQSWFNQLIHLSNPRSADQSIICLNHGSEYIERARHASLQGESMLDSPDVSICDQSYDIALQAVGASLELADRLMTGEINNGFGLIRPPGHHAEQGMALGFCLFNNIAILARYLQQEYDLEKILILDWDVHHGNGTQHSFQEDPSVLYISLHQYPFYPGTGSRSESGEGKGKGSILNCPMNAGATDEIYEMAFQEKVLPKIHQFRPDVVLISAGFDAHRADPLAQVNLSTESFGWMTQWMMEIADQYSEGRLISLLEGGYDLQALPLCVAEHLINLNSG